MTSRATQEYMDYYKTLNNIMDLLDEQLPGANKKSSIAMSPWKLYPLMPSNVIYKDGKKRQHIIIIA